MINSMDLKAQSAGCDTCTAPWGPVQDLVITDQTIPTKMSGCLYTFVYKFRMRDCNGEIQIDIVDMMARLQSGCKTFCCLNQPTDCYNSWRSAKRALANHLGPITLTKEAACYMMFEVDPPQAFINCAVSPGESVDHWYAYLSCDTTSCCKVILTPLGGGPVQSDEVVSIGCNGNVPPVPASVEWECGGITYVIPVLPGQSPSCETTCNGGSDILHKRSVDQTEDQQDKSENLKLYPNPARESLHIDYKTNSQESLELRIYSLQGMLVKKIDLKGSNGSIDLNIKGFASGRYICNIYAGDNKIMSESFSVVE